MADLEDPLIAALPPATDHLTYLTLLEYQLTPARLPTLHSLLQDESLTSSIGWDLVQLLLPMLPQSRECLTDVARLGNPREVILRVSESLMRLQPEDDDDNNNDEDNENDNDNGDEKKSQSLPRHILQFNSLIAMLSVLHSRIRTQHPSRFVATSLHAALEAYTSMPTSETTLALLELFRDLSPKKRPALPPRAPSESSVVRVPERPAPDPEADTPALVASEDERKLIGKYLQFGLVELLKSYLLSFSTPMDPGMSWAARLQEKLHPEWRMPEGRSQTDLYAGTKHLAERDVVIGKITVCLAEVLCQFANRRSC